jgi:hypothetical protein
MATGAALANEIEGDGGLNGRPFRRSGGSTGGLAQPARQTVAKAPRRQGDKPI